MKQLVYIFIFCLLPVALASGQEEEQNIVNEVNEDDLGNVTSEFQEQFFEALKQKAIENYQKAITALEVCKKLEPQNPVVYFELAKNYRELEQYDAALINFNKARELDPEREILLYEIYQTYLAQEDFQKAVESIKQLVEFNQNYEKDLANVYMLAGEYDKALEVIEDLEKKYGQSGYRTQLKRQIYARTGNTNAQISELEESISADPENEQNYLNLIYMYSEQGDEEGAFQVAQDLLEINPGSTLVHLALYKFYLSRNQPEEAVKSMKLVFESEEIDADSKFRVLNDFLLFVNENPEYKEDLLEVSQLLSGQENSPLLFEQLGNYYLENGMRKDALLYFETALAENSENFELFRNTIVLQLEFEQYAAALENSQQALDLYPGQPLLYLFKGVAHNKLGEYGRADEILTFGLDYVIDNRQLLADFYNQLSIAAKGLGNISKAEEYTRKLEEPKKQE
ncbi:tetratricopeptide repeat protein [Salegentibacter sp. HM20]